MNKARFSLITIAVFAFIMVSCEKDPVEEKLKQDHMIINNNLSKLSQRVNVIDGGQLMPVTDVYDAGYLKGLKSDTEKPKYEIYLRAEVDPPDHFDKTLQASHIRLSGNYAFVTYNLKGPDYLGGVDVFDVSDIENPVLIQNVIFPDRDINSIDINPDGDENHKFIYLTGAVNTDYSDLMLGSPAFVEVFRANQSYQIMDLDYPQQYYDLASYAGNDVRYDQQGSQDVYVTSGSDGGLAILDNELQHISYESIPYARSIDIDGNYVVVYSAQNSRLIVMNVNGEVLREIETGGEHFIDDEYLEAKSIVRLKDNLAFVATGTAGMEIYDIITGNMVGSLPRPAEYIDAYDPLNYVTNGVSVDENLILAANGGSGVHIAELEDDGENRARSIGKFMFESGTSANFVEASGNKIFVASGKGGLKILEIVEIDDCYVSVKYPFTGSPAYFPEVEVTDGGVYTGTYKGWCAESHIVIAEDTPYPAQVYSSLDNLNGKGVVERPEHLAKVNWILNQEYVGAESDAGGTYTFGDVQYAIWHFISKLPPVQAPPHNMDRVNEIIALAEINEPDFVLQCGHVYAIIFSIDDAQNIIIEYPYPCDK